MLFMQLRCSHVHGSVLLTEELSAVTYWNSL